jgi:hypothetical protein
MAKKTANQMAKSKKPAKVKSPGKTASKIATVAGPLVMGAAIAITERQKKTGKYSAQTISGKRKRNIFKDR